MLFILKLAKSLSLIIKFVLGLNFNRDTNSKLTFLGQLEARSNESCTLETCSCALSKSLRGIIPFFSKAVKSVTRCLVLF
jgi:hypothetical protein